MREEVAVVELLVARCAGLDVAKEEVVATLVCAHCDCLFQRYKHVTGRPPSLGEAGPSVHTGPAGDRAARGFWCHLPRDVGEAVASI
jgi:hypothetical protein